MQEDEVNDCSPGAEKGHPTDDYSYVDAARLIDVDSVTADRGFASNELYKGYSQHRMNFKNQGTSPYTAGGIGIRGDVVCLY